MSDNIQVITAQYDVICHTEECENGGITLRVLAEVDHPAVACGPCGQLITDVTPVEA